MSKETRQCIFDNSELVKRAFNGSGDPLPCSGKTTRHHVRAKREGGNGDPGNLQDVCEGHHRWINMGGEREAEKRERADGTEVNYYKSPLPERGTILFQKVDKRK